MSTGQGEASSGRGVLIWIWEREPKKSGTATLVGAKTKKPLSCGPSDLGFLLGLAVDFQIPFWGLAICFACRCRLQFILAAPRAPACPAPPNPLPPLPLLLRSPLSVCIRNRNRTRSRPQASCASIHGWRQVRRQRRAQQEARRGHRPQALQGRQRIHQMVTSPSFLLLPARSLGRYQI